MKDVAATPLQPIVMASVPELTLPKPYFEKQGITIYHGDCRDVLHLIDADLCLTDPPWGVSNNNANQKRKRGYSAYDPNQPSKDWKPCFGDDRPFDPTPLLRFKNVVMWGANHFADKLPASSFWFCWDRKCEKAADSDTTDCELAWVRGKKYRTTRMFRHMWAGFQRDSQVGQKHKHPMEKPVALMSWCLSWFPDAAVVVDPYMGSGPVLEAALLNGRKAIGFEIEEEYCEVAAKRLAQGVLF
jgi:site-specific DNA-methyltransferase (adenine-specific)